jgi:hypothetical protein
MTEKELMKIKRSLKTRAKKLHLGKKRSGAYVFGTLRKIQGNPAMFVRTPSDVEKIRMQLAKGMVIEEVSRTRAGFRVLLTTPSSRVKAIPFEEFKNMLFFKAARNNPANPAAQKRRDGMSATILITAIESGYGWFYTKNYKIAEIDETPYKVSADLFLDEEVTKDDYPDEFSKDYQPKRTFKAGEKIHVDNSTIQKGLQLVSSGKVKVADSYRKLASKLYFWPYDKNSQGHYDMPDFDAYDADIFLQAGIFGNVIFG